MLDSCPNKTQRISRENFCHKWLLFAPPNFLFLTSNINKKKREILLHPIILRQCYNSHSSFIFQDREDPPSDINSFSSGAMIIPVWKKKAQEIRSGTNKNRKLHIRKSGAIVSCQRNVKGLGTIMSDDLTSCDDKEAINASSRKTIGWILRTFKTRDSQPAVHGWRFLEQLVPFGWIYSFSPYHTRLMQ